MDKDGTKRALARSEKSAESIPRPTKFFKLDRTYSDVVEDELYDPQPEPLNTSPKLTSNTAHKTQRIQNVYPELFNQTQGPPDSDDRDDETKYWPGMESGIRFDKARGRQSSTVIADKKQKMQNQPEQKTVSPKEAFLDYQDPVATTPSLFGPASTRQSTMTSDTSDSTPKRPTLFPTLSSLEGFTDMEPKTITPVRQKEQLSPKPVAPHGPTPDQVKDNTTANAQIRALYTEDSTVSMTTNAESTPDGGDSDYAPYKCEECHQQFEKLATLNTHRKVHAVPMPVYRDQHPTSAAAAAAGDESESPNKNPHRCDWIIPSTGAVCGVIFSRPYDLVRHQDTIHRAKKLEFKCEECIRSGINKVFSRNDALVRHLRHVHKKEPKK